MSVATWSRVSGGRMNATEFWSRAECLSDDECWLWQGSPNREYGQVWWNGRKELAHRVAWAIHNDAPLPELCVCHSCDEPRCVNPAHLWLGTRRDNNRDRDTKGRASGGSQPGEVNPRSRLTAEAIRDIRAMAAAGMLQTHLAAAFGVSTMCISDVVCRRRWKHV